MRQDKSLERSAARAALIHAGFSDDAMFDATVSAYDAEVVTEQAAAAERATPASWNGGF